MSVKVSASKASAKARRGPLRLVAVDESQPRAVKARDISLLPTDSAEDAAVCVLSNALDQFVANVPAFRLAEAVESVHQMRVALRRLRAAAAMFRPAVGGEHVEAALARAKRIATVLGQARDWDVFQEMLDQIPREQFTDERAFVALLDAVELRRRAAYRAALALFDGTEPTNFVTDLRRLIATRGWRATAAATAPGSAQKFAAHRLSQLRKRVLKKSHGLARLNVEQRHEARIALKKARYGAEFFQTLFGHRRRARAFSRALADLQDGLGVYNDLATADRLLDEIDAANDAKACVASGLVRGWFAHAARAGAAHAEDSEKQLKELKPFWR